MEMKIKMHSLIDVITNSSTEIFITMGSKSVEGMFEIFNEVLKIAGSDKKAEELFDIKIEQDWDYIVDRFIDNDEFEEGEESKLMEEYKAIAKYEEREKFTVERIIPYLEESGRWKDFNTNYYDMEYDSWLNIKAKDQTKSTMEIWNKIRNLFGVDAIRNG